MRALVVALSALLVVTLSACSVSSDPEIKRVCRVMADHTSALAGVTKASFNVVVHSNIASCAGVVDTRQDMTSTDLGTLVGSTYDSVRDADIYGDRISTRFTRGPTTLMVVSGGFPHAAEATALVDAAASVHATSLFMSVGSSGLAFGDLGVRLSTTAPAESLDEALRFVESPLPHGVSGLSWSFNDSQIFVDRADAAELASLASIASWFARHPGISAFELTSESHLDTWALTTLVEAPDLAREFAALAAGCGHAVAVRAQLKGEKPYLTLP